MMDTMEAVLYNEREVLEDVLSEFLTWRELEVIKMRFDRYTLNQIADRFGVTVARIVAIRKHAMRKIERRRDRVLLAR